LDGWLRASPYDSVAGVKKTHPKWGKYDELTVNLRKIIKVEQEIFTVDQFRQVVEGKMSRRSYDVNFFAELIDFSSGRYDQSKFQTVGTNSRSGSVDPKAAPSKAPAAPPKVGTGIYALRPYNGTSKLPVPFFIIS
jgi:hypothetical protein